MLPRSPTHDRPQQAADAEALVPATPVARRWWNTGRGRASLIAGTLLIAGALLIPRTPGVPEAPAVTITAAGSDASLIQRVSILRPKPGMRLRAGNHVTGACELGWEDGTTLAMESGTDLEIGPGPGIALHLIVGGLRLKVSPQPAGRPLAIRTQHGTATVFDSGFTLTADNDRSSLTVRHGAVEFRSADGSPARLVTAGMQASIDGRGPPTAAPPGSDAVPTVRVVLDAVAERGAGWHGTPVAEGVRAVRNDATGWACGTRSAPVRTGLIAAGRALRIRTTCTAARSTEIGVVIVVSDARTGAFLCNRQAIRKVMAGVPTVLDVGWDELDYVAGPTTGPDAALQGQAVTKVGAFAWGEDPGLVLQRVELLSGGR